MYLFDLVFLFLFSNIYPGVELLGHMVVLFLVFWETILFAPMDILTNSVWGFFFSHILTNICYLCSFWWQPDKCEVISHCGFTWHFPDHWPSDLFFGKLSVQIFCPFFNQVARLFFSFLILELFIYFWILAPYWSYICRCLLPLSRLSFYFVTVFLSCAGAFNFH